MFDAIDLKILDLLQQDASLPLTSIADSVGLSSTPCWRRIKRLEEQKIILSRVALLDQSKLNVPVSMILQVRAPNPGSEWRNRLRRFVALTPEITTAYQITGDNAFVLHTVLPEMGAYLDIRERLTSELGCTSIEAHAIVETLKTTTALPTHYSRSRAN